MKREEIILKCYNSFVKGYFKVKDAPLESCGNNLEFTGKLGIALTEQEKIEHSELITKIQDGLHQNLISMFGNCYIPRTIYTGTNDPNEQERKPNRWERIHKNFWGRTDVSYSQLGFLFQGTKNILPTRAESIQYYLNSNKFVIKRHDGKPATNGNFNIPLPNTQLRKMYIKLCMNKKTTLLERFYYFLMQWPPCNVKSDNGFNTIVLLYSISSIKGRSNRLVTKIKRFVEQWRFLYPSNPSFQDEIEWLLIDKIRMIYACDRE